MGSIYKICNKINKKCYIGQTRNNIKQRWREHKSRAKNLSTTLMIDIIMHNEGISNFTIELIEDNIDDNELDEKEKYYIHEFNTTIPNGYNILSGGKNGAKEILQINPHDFSVIKVWDSQLQAAKYHKCHPSNISEACNKPMLIKGYYWCRINDYSKNRFKNVGQRKQVIQIDDNDNIINIYNSQIEAAKALGHNDGSRIGQACKNNIKAYGFKWKWR